VWLFFLQGCQSEKIYPIGAQKKQQQQKRLTEADRVSLFF
jgi:hypothetical protein